MAKILIIMCILLIPASIDQETTIPKEAKRQVEEYIPYDTNPMWDEALDSMAKGF